MTILVTGATGFVGNALVKDLLSKSYEIKGLVRQFSAELPLSVEQVVVGDLADLTLSDSAGVLREAFNGVEVIVHTAARAHIIHDNTSDPLLEYRKVNRDATWVFARLASECGVKRFVFLSSIGVNGNNNQIPFTENDTPKPQDFYAISKYEAEQGLFALAKETGMEVVVIRPPLVYGPNAPGNFGDLVKWMGRPIPLPFGAIHNKRSLVALDNLVSFISLCANQEKSPLAANQVFLVSDGEYVSTTQLLRKVGQALTYQSSSGVKAWLVPIPVVIMTFFAKILGKGAMANRLFGSLQVNSSKARDSLRWQPVVTMDEQLSKMVMLNENENEKSL